MTPLEQTPCIPTHVWSTWLHTHILHRGASTLQLVVTGSKLPREVFHTLIRHQIKTRKKRSLSSQVTYNPDWPWKLQTTIKNKPLNYHRDSYMNLGYWESTAMRYTPEKWSFDTYHGFYIAGPIKGPKACLSGTHRFMMFRDMIGSMVWSVLAEHFPKMGRRGFLFLNIYRERTVEISFKLL